MSELVVGDIGTVIELTITEDGVVVNLSTATVTKNIIFKKPSGTIVTKAAAFTTDGTDGKIQYTTTVASDLDAAGIWHAQAQVVLATGTWRTNILSFTVGSQLA